MKDTEHVIQAGQMPAPKKIAANLPRAGKYRNTKVVDANGQRFDSKREHRRHGQLLLLAKAGFIHDLQTQVRFELLPSQKTQSGKTERPVHYLADFVYKTKQGIQVVEDTKGVRTADYVIKRKLMLHLHGIEIAEV